MTSFRALPAIGFLLVAVAAEAVTPDFGPNVLMVDPSMQDLQGRLDAIFKKQERSQFGPDRYAYLFKPGTYHLDVQMGFYMQAVGLGRNPDDVSIVGSVRSLARWMRRRNATCNFWRSAENLSITPTVDGPNDIWAVSQGTALRRVHVRESFALDGGWASGGFMADCQVDGEVDAGTQQQWLARNSGWKSWKGANWNMVFVGTTNPPAGAWPKPPVTVVDQTPVIAEKPYLFIDGSGHYFVFVPQLTAHDTRGTTWSQGSTPGEALPLDRFYLAHPDRDSAASLNAALEAGKNLLFTPGIYHLEASLSIGHPETVVLGLGFPTLIPVNGTAAMSIANVAGVRIGGLLLEAGPLSSPTLLQVGQVKNESQAAAPVFLYDLFCRAGGAAPGSTRCFVTIDSNNVVGDNFWLWRADHGRGAGWASNPNANGLVVNGRDVTLYGLFVEHCQEYQTVWNGEGGRVYFYQSEMPYDPPSQAIWSHAGVDGFASYKVGAGVKTHEAWGMGVYTVFYSAPVVAENAFETPVGPGIRLHHMVILRLNGRPGSGIRHVLNGRGDPVISTKVSWLED